MPSYPSQTLYNRQKNLSPSETGFQGRTIQINKQKSENITLTLQNATIKPLLRQANVVFTLGFTAIERTIFTPDWNDKNWTTALDCSKDFFTTDSTVLQPIWAHEVELQHPAKRFKLQRIQPYQYHPSNNCKHFIFCFPSLFHSGLEIPFITKRIWTKSSSISYWLG